MFSSVDICRRLKIHFTLGKNIFIFLFSEEMWFQLEKNLRQLQKKPGKQKSAYYQIYN